MSVRRVCAKGAAVALLALGALGGAATAEPVQRSAGGLVLNGELVTAPGKAPADGTVLLVHGTLAHNGMEIITALQERLAERGLSSLAVTLSLGESDRRGMFDCSHTHAHRTEDATAEIAGWAGWLAERGVARLVLMGHSRGANQAAWAAAEGAVPAAARLVLLAPSTGTAPATAAAVLAAADGQPDAAVVAVPAFLTCGAGHATAAAVRSYYADRQRFDTLALLEKAGRPVLVIAGTEDRVVPDLAGRLGAVSVSGGSAQVRVIEGADHVFQDFYADDVADAVAAFAAAP